LCAVTGGPPCEPSRFCVPCGMWPGVRRAGLPRQSVALTRGQRRRVRRRLIISKWAGHYDSAFTQKTYVHASDEDPQRGQAALAKIHKIG
jgi:hypothetical protein